MSNPATDIGEALGSHDHQHFTRSPNQHYSMIDSHQSNYDFRNFSVKYALSIYDNKTRRLSRVSVASHISFKLVGDRPECAH